MTIARIIFLLLPLTILFSCGNDPKDDPQYQQYVEDAQRAEKAVAERDSVINDLFGTLNRISENLRTIRSKQGRLVRPEPGVEQDKGVEEKIMADIEAIDALIAENNMLMERLRMNSDLGSTGISALQRTLADMEQTLADQNNEIDQLKEELASSNSTLATLIEMYRDKEQLAERQQEELNTAYYAVGTTRELRANGILSREGGVAGIGGVNKLDLGNLPKGYFRKVDISHMQEIPVVANKASLATPHPEGSYRFENGAEKLVITSPAEFWSVSKYLVVVVEK